MRKIGLALGLFLLSTAGFAIQVNGPLTGASLEKLSSAPAIKTVGRIYWDTVLGGAQICNGAGCSTVGGSTGTVTSVGMSVPSWLSVAGSPVTSSGTLAVTGASQSQNLFLASPNGSSGAMTPRAIVAADVPTLNQNTTGTASNVTSTVAIANGGTGQTTQTASFNALSPMTTAGDVIFGSTAGSGVRLAKGADGQVLTLSSGFPLWSTPSSSFANPMTSTGDLIFGSTSGAATRLPKATDGQMLTLTSGFPTWTTPFTSPMTTAGDLIFGSTSGAASRRAKGADGQVLTLSSGFPGWSDPFTNPMTTAGDIIFGSTSGAAARRSKGSEGQVLTLSAGFPLWSTPASSATAGYVSGWYDNLDFSTTYWSTSSTTYADLTKTGNPNYHSTQSSGFGSITQNGGGVALSSTPTHTGLVEVTLTMVVQCGGASQAICQFQLLDNQTSTVFAYAAVTGYNPVTSQGYPMTIHGLYNVTSGVSFLPTLQGKTSTGTVYVGYGASLQGGVSWEWHYLN